MRVDAHQHFWEIRKYEYVWMSPEMGILYNDYGPDDLQPLLQQHDITCSILVQTISSVNETRWFLELARTHPFIGGVVGWVDLTSPTVPDVLDELREDPKLVGIRHQVHDEPDDRWLLREDVQRGLGELQARSTPYELLIRPQHLEISLEVARKFSTLPLAIDHIAKPNIAKRQWDDWAEGITKLADCDNVFCKLSGMITEADIKNWKPEDIQPYVHHVIESFGPQRCMFGSDWPVCLLAGSYDQVNDTLSASIEQLTDSDKQAILGDTAAAFYGLEKAQ